MGADIIISKYTYTAMCIIGCLLQASNGFIDSSRSILFSSIKKLFDIDSSVTGLIVSCLGYAMIVFMFLATLLLAKSSFKVVQIIGIVVWLIAFILLYYIHDYTWVIACLFVMWFGTAFTNIGATALPTTIFVKNSALMVGLINFAYSVGLLIGPYIYTPILATYENAYWYVYLVFGCFCIVFLIYIIITRNKWTIIPDKEELNAPKMSTFGCFKDPLFWVELLICSCLQQIHFMTLDWGLIYLENYLGWKPTEKGSIFNQIYSIIYAISRCLFSFITSKLGPHNAMIEVTVGIVIFSTLGMCFTNDGAYLLAGVGFFTGPTFPLLVLMTMDTWGSNSTIIMSLLVSLYGIIKEIMNYAVGLVNDTYGYEWGFRLMVPYSVLQLILVIIAKVMMVKRLNRKKLVIHQAIPQIDKETPMSEITPVAIDIKEDIKTPSPSSPNAQN
ncbi:hypothetical protein WA158_002911 [Blastocystis sp. Blastoise]